MPIITRTRRDLLRNASGLAGLLAMPHLARAQGPDRVRFSLELRVYGGNSPMFLGAESGIFRDQGIAITMDGSTTAASCRRPRTAR
jgi:NitT/TauT family transport system substrate-binding protein